MDLIGRRLGDYEIKHLVGRGSMARVYHAYQVPLRRHVALKVLEEAIFTPSKKIKRFFREAEAMARLEHPHIVPIYAAGQEAPYYFFAMQLAPGGSLRDAMRGAVPYNTAFDWIHQTCRGLAYAHASGVIHRDLKPSNVLLHHGVALLGDFGLARLRDATTITEKGFVLGTPLYMSPEQTLGEETVRSTTDCFALGVILYELLTGQHPFLDDEQKAGTGAQMNDQLLSRLLIRIRNVDFKPPSSVDPDIPPAVENVILRALSRSPRDRYPDGAAMLLDLDEARRTLTDTKREVHFKPRVDETFPMGTTKTVRVPVACEGQGPEGPPPTRMRRGSRRPIRAPLIPCRPGCFSSGVTTSRGRSAMVGRVWSIMRTIRFSTVRWP